MKQKQIKKIISGWMGKYVHVSIFIVKLNDPETDKLSVNNYFEIIYLTIFKLICFKGFNYGRLSSLSIIFQLHRGGQFH
jgi:hypothetical protein